jgi:hypothetical protein
MSTIDTLAKRLDTIHNDGGELTLEDYVLSKPLIREGKTHAQCIKRLYPYNTDPPFAPELIAQ